jgi:L-lactate dehydrogenase complex protein LldE
MTVSLFIPCLTDAFFPESGWNMVRVLERLGHIVEYRDAQTCCGQPAFNTGYRHEARELAQRFLRLFADAECVVAPSGSCVAMVKVFYAELLDRNPREAEEYAALAARMHEFTSFLVDVQGGDDVGAVFPHSVTVHDSCHALRELGVREQPRRLLRDVRGLELREMDAAQECCGFGGTFAVKHEALSSAMCESKVASVLRSGASVVTGVDSSCLMNIGGMLRRRGSTVRCLHIADILAADA